MKSQNLEFQTLEIYLPETIPYYFRVRLFHLSILFLYYGKGRSQKQTNQESPRRSCTRTENNSLPIFKMPVQEAIPPT